MSPKEAINALVQARLPLVGGITLDDRKALREAVDVLSKAVSDLEVLKAANAKLLTSEAS